jgi:hypothetical protein
MHLLDPIYDLILIRVLEVIAVFQLPFKFLFRRQILINIYFSNA